MPRGSRRETAAGASSWPLSRSLLEDGSLAIQADAAARAAVERWMPRIPAADPDPAAVRAWIRVERATEAGPRPEHPPILQLHDVSCWRMDDGRAVVAGPGMRASAVLDLRARRARVRTDVAGAAPDDFTLHVVLTVTAAFLLGRTGRTLVHAGAVVHPGGTALLLVGGTFSGKTTTCLGLIRQGWDYLADDHVILSRQGSGIRVEGWPRSFNVDRGYARGAPPERVRGRMDPDLFGPGRWRRSAALGGLLFPEVDAGRPTAAGPIAAADALGRLLEQSPWLLADRGTAVDVLALLGQAAGYPVRALRLGTDTYDDSARLARLLLAER